MLILSHLQTVYNQKQYIKKQSIAKDFQQAFELNFKFMERSPN